MPLSEIIIRGMPTHPPDEEPEVFDAYALVHRLLDARDRAQVAMETIESANHDLSEADREIRSLESLLAASFHASEVKAITFDHRYKRFVILPVNGEIVVHKAGYTNDLNPPVHHGFTIPAEAATAVNDDWDVPEPSLMAVL